MAEEEDDEGEMKAGSNSKVPRVWSRLTMEIQYVVAKPCHVLSTNLIVGGYLLH
jgi:hypothetical protein